VRERIEIHDHRLMINLSWKCCLGTKPIRAAKHYTALPVGLGKQLGCRHHPGGGLSVDASVRIEGPDPDSLERLLRYCALAGFTHSLSRGNTSRPLSLGIEGSMTITPLGVAGWTVPQLLAKGAGRHLSTAPAKADSG